MRDMFPALEIMPLYGAFAFMVFWGLNHDALYETPEGTELTRFILGMDKALTDAGILPTYFAHIIARKITPFDNRSTAQAVIQAPFFIDMHKEQHPYSAI